MHFETGDLKHWAETQARYDPLAKDILVLFAEIERLRRAGIPGPCPVCGGPARLRRVKICKHSSTRYIVVCLQSSHYSTGDIDSAIGILRFFGDLPNTPEAAWREHENNRAVDDPSYPNGARVAMVANHQGDPHEEPPEQLARTIAKALNSNPTCDSSCDDIGLYQYNGPCGRGSDSLALCGEMLDDCIVARNEDWRNNAGGTKHE